MNPRDPRSGMWQLVSSENLAWTRYRVKDGAMDVIFRNAPSLVYTYENVTWETYRRVVMAKSIGQEFNLLIRSRPEDHPYTRKRKRITR